MSKKQGYIYLFLSMLAFSTMEVSSKFITNSLHPLQINFLRFLFGGLALLPFAVRHVKVSAVKLTNREIGITAALGVLLVPVSMVLFQFSIFYTKASITAVLISCNAIFAAPMSYVLLKEKTDRSIMISLVSGIIGIAVIASPTSGIAGSDMIGIVLGVLSSITFSLYNVLGKKLIPKLGGVTLNTLAFLFGSIAMVPLLFLMKVPMFSGLSSTNLLYMLYIGIVVTAFAYIVMFKGFTVLPVNAGSLVFFGKPVLAGVLSYLLLGETFSISFIAGSLFILLGILAVVIRK